MSIRDERAYNVLMICDYDDPQPKVRQWYNSIFNNLGEYPINNEPYMPMKKKNNLKISTLDRVNSIEGALEFLSKVHYDAIISTVKLNGKNIGSGSFNKLRNACPPGIQGEQTVFIILLPPYLKFGTVNVEGEISGGAKVQNLLENGYYNAQYINSLSLNTIVDMIKKGGYSYQWAKEFYGLANKAVAIEMKATTEEKPVLQATPIPPKQEQPAPQYHETYSEPQRETVKPKAEEDKYTHEKGLNKPLSASNSNQNQPTQATKEARLPQEEQSQNQKNRKQDKKQHQKQHQNPHMENSHRLDIASVQTATEKNKDAVKNLAATVTFAQGNTVILELSKDLEEYNLSVTDVVGMPVNIPYMQEV